MRYFFTLLLFVISGSFSLQAQDSVVITKHDYDSTKWDIRHADTAKIGNILFITMHRKGDTLGRSTVVVSKRKVSNTWLAFDLGFSNWVDKNNYGSPGSYVISNAAMPVGAGDFKLKTGKSINVGIWLMHKTPLVKEAVNLKYGLGVELNNYRFRSPLSFRENGPKPYGSGNSSDAFVFRDSISFSKNKLALDYVSVPLMLNFATRGERFYISGGASIGYLYSQRNKQKSDARGKQKNKGNFDIEKFKLSYIGEVGFNGIAIYGAYTPKTIFERDLNVKPFNIGLRFSY